MFTKATVQDGITIVEFSKDVDRFTLAMTEEVRSELSPLLDDPNCKMIIDLNHVDFVDSSAIGIFIALVKTAKKIGSQIKFCHLTPEVVKVFTLLHLQVIFDIRATLRDCIEAYKN